MFSLRCTLSIGLLERGTQFFSACLRLCSWWTFLLILSHPFTAFLLTQRNRVGWKWFLFRYWLLSPWSIMQLLLSDVHGSVGVRTGGLWGAAVLGSSFSRSNSPALPGFRANVISKQDS